MQFKNRIPFYFPTKYISLIYSIQKYKSLNYD